MYKKKWQEICRIMDSIKNRKIKVEKGVGYIEFQDTEPLRRDYAGVLNRHRFEDRVVLKDNKKTKITGMIIYESERGIICMQAFYDNGEKSYISLPSHAL